MPVHKVPGGWQWGTHGKVYASKKDAVDQEQAAIANGFKESPQTTAVKNLIKKHGGKK